MESGSKIKYFLAVIVVAAVLVVIALLGGNEQEGGMPLSFPETLDTQYIHAVDWPPQVIATDESYSCTTAGEEGDRAGMTQERIIAGERFCVTVVTGAAAGSVYRQYAYARAVGTGTEILTFSLQYPQCANYSMSESLGCEDEQGSFNPDSLISQALRNRVK